jgi:hypothetical protein
MPPSYNEHLQTKVRKISDRNSERVFQQKRHFTSALPSCSCNHTFDTTLELQSGFNLIQLAFQARSMIFAFFCSLYYNGPYTAIKLMKLFTMIFSYKKALVSYFYVTEPITAQCRSHSSKELVGIWLSNGREWVIPKFLLYRPTIRSTRPTTCYVQSENIIQCNTGHTGY